MTDDQFEDLIKVLATPKKEPTSLFRKVVDATVLALVVSVTVGFFTMLWQGYSGYGEAITSLMHQDRVRKIENKVTMDLLSQEIIKLQGEHGTFHDEVEAHEIEIQEKFLDHEDRMMHMIDDLEKANIKITPPHPAPALEPWNSFPNPGPNPVPGSAAKRFDKVGSPLKEYENKREKFYQHYRDRVQQQVQQIAPNVQQFRKKK